MDKIKSLVGVLAMAGACAFGGETNNVSYANSHVGLKAVYNSIPLPKFSCEKVMASTTNRVVNIYSKAEKSCEAVLKRGKTESEKFVDCVHEFLHTPFTMSIDPSGLTAFYYECEF